jgi:hypothetical protein
MVNGWTVLFEKNGAFVIDGLRLDALGDAEFARAWDSRPLSDLLSELKRLRR